MFSKALREKMFELKNIERKNPLMKTFNNVNDNLCKNNLFCVGYGFCEYKDQETALSAMRNLNGYEIAGRTLR